MITKKIDQLTKEGAVGLISTILPSGHIQTQPVWVDSDGEHILVNTEVERRKFKNLLENPHVTVVILDPSNLRNWSEVRGTMVEAVHGQPARDHIDSLAGTYLGKAEYPNPIRSPRVIIKIAPEQIFEFPPGA